MCWVLGEEQACFMLVLGDRYDPPWRIILFCSVWVGDQLLKRAALRTIVIADP